MPQSRGVSVNYHADRLEIPQTIDSEQALLGAILHNAEALDAARDHVEPDDFHEELHRLIFQAMCERRDQGEVIDAHLVRLVIGDRDLGGVTVGQYLARLHAEATTVMNARDYAKAIRNAALMRKLLSVSQDAIAAMSVGMVINPSRYASEMIEYLDQIATATRPQSLRQVTMGEAVRGVLERVERARNGENMRGTTLGLPSLDRMTLGAHAGDLIILAGRPGMGKTTKALHIAMSAAKSGEGCAFISLEMTAQQLGERAVACAAYSPYRDPLPYTEIRLGANLTAEQFQRLQDAQDAVDHLPLWIEQEPGLTVSQIAARARQLKARAERRGQKLSIVVVDHLGLVRASKRYAGNRVQEISEITAALKVLAKELEVAVVALCQLNRGVEGRNDKRPQLMDLRDSGSIEQDADMVIGLFRPAYYLENKADLTSEEHVLLERMRHELEVIVLKQRQGPTGTVQCFCDIGANIVAEVSN